MSKFTPYMIVYSKNQSRYQNYLKIREQLDNVVYFEAVDTIDDTNWNKWSVYAQENGLTTEEYVKEIGNFRGKLGCNLSHQTLLKEFNNDGKTDWLLVMEDDVVLTDYTIDKIKTMIDFADSRESKYIQLYTHPRFNSVQYSSNRCLDTKSGLFTMIPQWGTVAYLIHKDAICSVVEQFPISTNMDYIYNQNIEVFKSMCQEERIFFTSGTLDSEDNNSHMGSLIWNKPDSNSHNTTTPISESINHHTSISLPEISLLNASIYLIPNTYNFLTDIKGCEYTYKNIGDYTIPHLKQSIAFFVNPFIRLVLAFKYWKNAVIDEKNVDEPKLFEQFITFSISTKINNEYLELQSNLIKYKSKIYPKVIRIEDYENDLSKMTCLDTLNRMDKDTLLNMFKYIQCQIYDSIPNWYEMYHNNQKLQQLVKNKYRMDFMIAGYPIDLPDKMSVISPYDTDFKLNNNVDVVFSPITFGSYNDGDGSDGVNDSGNTVCFDNKQGNNGDVCRGNIENGNGLDETDKSEVFQTLWVGSTFTDMEIISLNSFVKHDMVIHLYCYYPISNVPKGVIIKDARDIVPEDELFTYKNGSYSAFSNLFRFVLLYKKGGYWVDTDFVCLKKINYSDRPYVIVSEPSEDYTREFVTSCIIKLPKNSAESILGMDIQKEHKKLILDGKITWSSGPKTVDLIVSKFNLNKYVLKWSTICTCFCHHSKSLIDSTYNPFPQMITTMERIPPHMIGIHLWNECWRRNNMYKNDSYPEDSIYQNLRNKYITNDFIENTEQNTEQNTTCKTVILYMIHKTTYLTKMSRVRFHGITALSNIDDIEVIYYGPEWDHYQHSLTVTQNIENLKRYYMGHNSTELIISGVIAYKPLDFINYSEIPYHKIIRYNEMYDVPWTKKEILESGSQLVICHHLNDCQEYQKMNLKTKKGINIDFIYIGHCADDVIYKDYGMDKKYDLMLAGCLNQQHYPLRNRLKKIMEDMSSEYTIYIHPHPGYDLKDANTNKYQIEFAKAIHQAKIVLTDTGITRSRYGKYVEVPACHSVIAGDIPDDTADDYSYVIELNMEMTDESIKHELKKYLDDTDLYNEKIQKGIIFANEYTQEKYAERFYTILKKYLVFV